MYKKERYRFNCANVVESVNSHIFINTSLHNRLFTNNSRGDKMSGIIKSLLKITGSSSSKSYFVGLHRGRIWAEEYADYFEMKEWSDMDHEEFDKLLLPHNEKLHFTLLNQESPLEWQEYLRGWIEGVKEIADSAF
ncbi:Uncharacterised protein [Candidatus Bilamarchaeum dharawalense]|uniref:Uncharacterized protein n=1 Tax=Candidatus Bilamarchaeum dharawalense TaxID=2885759 RepID=A0A5E4LRQ6_9ARCH|nr:Uncharacterised protein [Candidatus Bilamarchaeum dharawalense]